MSRRSKLTVIVAVLIAAVAVIVIVWQTTGSEERTLCEEAERALERIDEIEGPGYDEGLESLDHFRQAAESEDPPDQPLIDLIDQLTPLLGEVNDAYDRGSYEAIDALDSDTRDEFNSLTDQLDVAMADRCPSVYGTTPPSPDSSPPPPTTVEGTTTPTS